MSSETVRLEDLSDTSRDSVKSISQHLSSNAIKKLQASGEKPVVLKTSMTLLIAQIPIMMMGNSSIYQILFVTTLAFQVLLITITPGLEYIFKHFKVADEKIEDLILLVMTKVLEGMTYLAGIFLLFVSHEQSTSQ